MDAPTGPSVGDVVKGGSKEDFGVEAVSAESPVSIVVVNIDAEDRESATTQGKLSDDADAKPDGLPRSKAARVRGWWATYFRKWGGQQRRALKHGGFALRFDTLWSTLNSFLGILAVAGINQVLVDDNTDYVMLIGSFGASAVLLYSAWDVPLAQPRNLIGGHVLSAIVGVTVRIIFQSAPDAQFVACALSVALAIAVMEMTGTSHPPAGATSLIAVSGSQTILDEGYWYVLIPVLSGALILLAVALVMNNLSAHRSYPKYWW